MGKIKSYIESETAKDIQTLIAFTVRATPTQVDDKILDDVDDVKDMVSDLIDGLADVEPTEKEAKEAAIRILEQIAKLTKTPWDDRFIALAKNFI